MIRENLGFGLCRVTLDNGLHCTEAAVSDDRLCRYHRKLFCGLTVKCVPESLSSVIRKRAKT